MAATREVVRTSVDEAHLLVHKVLGHLNLTLAQVAGHAAVVPVLGYAGVGGRLGV